MLPSTLIDIDALQVGMFIQLEMGWMNHPFPTSSFRLVSGAQIEALRGLGLKQVRYVPGKSLRPEAVGQRLPDLDATPEPMPESPSEAAPLEYSAATEQSAEFSVQDYIAQQQRCNARYHEAAAVYAQTIQSVDAAPQQARVSVDALVQRDVAELMAAENYAVHLLSQVSAQRPAMHAVNVMVLSLMLGRALGMGVAELEPLSAAALLHDVGKIMLPRHLSEPGARLNEQDRRRYEEHVPRSVELTRLMGYGASVLTAIAEHHEKADGSGFPRRLTNAQMSRHGQVLALTNRYDRLCNPLHGELALTPHEALARLYAQERKWFDAGTVLSAFIRLMGVYPPGSIVQLEDGRVARVVSSNSQFPLRPCVLPFEAEVPQVEQPVLNLAQGEGVGIRRSLRLQALSDQALEYFSPERHICYFFDRMTSAPGEKDEQV